MQEPATPVPAAARIAEAVHLEDNWRWADALEAWERAREAAAGDDRLVAECDSGRARALSALDRTDEADEADRGAARLFTAAGAPALAHLSEAALARRIGMAGRIDEALPLAEAARRSIDAIEALGAASELGEDPEVVLAGAQARQIVARLLFASGQPDEGEREYLEARDRFADAGDDRRLARCDAALALDLLGAGRFEDAEGRAEAAVAGLLMLDRLVDAAQLQVVLGRLQAEGERHEEALANLRAAAGVFGAEELWPSAAEAIHIEALVLVALQQEEPAIERLREAASVAQMADMPGGEGSSRLELAMALGRLGRLAEAAAEFELAARVLGEAGDEVGATHATYGLGATRHELGELEAALDAFASAAGSFAALEAVGARAQVQFDAGGTLAEMGRVDEALAMLDEAAAGFAVDGEPLHLALVRRTWGATAGFAGQAEGLDALQAARAVFAEHEAAWDVAECDGLAAQILGALGRRDEAIGAAESSVAGFRAVEDAVALAAAEMVLGRLLTDAGRPAEAIGHLEASLASVTAQGVETLTGPVTDALDAARRATTGEGPHEGRP